MSGTYRHGRVYCQMADCRNRTTRTVKLELPASWSTASEYSVRTVLVGVCGDCARDLESRARALTGARVEFGHLLTALDEAASREAELSEALREAVELIGSRLDLRRSPVYSDLRAVLQRLDGRALSLAARRAHAARREATGRRRTPVDDPGDPAA